MIHDTTVGTWYELYGRPRAEEELVRAGPFRKLM